MDTPITTLEMCAGYGGIGLGIKNIFGERLRTIAYCELEGFAQANLISKMEKGLLDAAPIWSDLKTFPYESFHGLVDILIAGYPCQPFSTAGKRAGKEDPRHLWPCIADGIRLLKPRMCFFENVEGHVSLGLSTVISDLEELGYKVSWGIFSASECLDANGRTAPHQRKRVFIMAHNNSERVQEFNRRITIKPTSSTTGNYGNNTWPSRPGKPQHEWEPPRVVNANNNGCIANVSQDETEQNSNRQENGLFGEASAMGNATNGRWRQCNSEVGSVSQPYEGCANPFDCGKIESCLGLHSDGIANGLGHAELSNIGNKELAEIREWMVKCDNRTDELRLLGNGVCPQTAEKAFITLLESLK